MGQAKKLSETVLAQDAEDTKSSDFPDFLFYSSAYLIAEELCGNYSL